MGGAAWHVARESRAEVESIERVLNDNIIVFLFIASTSCYLFDLRKIRVVEILLTHVIAYVLPVNGGHV